MKLAKRTYSLPSDIVTKFERSLPRGERSSFIAKLIEEWLEERKRLELRRQVIEGCQQMATHYREINQEWDRTSEEIWRDWDGNSQ
ncbi:MAG: hypothetical protein HY235_18975 [Acidobacteria bacterium]|nr:hypothetical protein [Acidobacteriota bacterium]